MYSPSGWFTHFHFEKAATGCGVLKRGKRGVAIKILQHALIELGYFMPVSTAETGMPDGIFGSETDGRVRDFQRNEMPHTYPDGMVGPLTLAALEKKLQNRPPTPLATLVWGEAPEEVPESPEEVDLGQNAIVQSAEKQLHPMACWAACLSFWGRYVGGTRPMMSQLDILRQYNHLVSTDGRLTGGMPTPNLSAIMLDKHPIDTEKHPHLKNKRWNASFWRPYDASNMSYSWLKTAGGGIGRAVYFGYTLGGMCHINVLIHYDLEGTDLVLAMEPYDGHFKLREIEYYKESTSSFFAYPL